MSWQTVHNVITATTGIFTSLVITIAHGEEIFDKLTRALGVKEFIEHRLHERRKKMGVFADIELALAAASELREALPDLVQAITDLKQAYADKSNPSQALKDLDAALTAVSPLVDQIIALVPPKTATPVVAPTPTTVTPPAAS